MKEERYFYVPNADTEKELPQDEAVHAIRVLRLHEGDIIFLMNGEGIFYKAEVTMTTGKRCAYKIIETMPQTRPWHAHLHIAMAPTKMMDRVEWMIEKATEIGCDEFSFLECQFSERRQLRTDRVEKIIVSAMKQSRKAWKPIANELQSFCSFIEQPRDGGKYICHCHDEVERTDLFELLKENRNNEGTPQDITILIGPEGDFSIEEVKFAIKNGYKSVSLGNQRLRTETAALSAVMQGQLTLRY